MSGYFDHTDYWYKHRNILFWTWTVVDIPILIGRYGRGIKYGPKIHVLGMIAVSLTTLITIVMQMVNSGTQGHQVKENMPGHFYFAWILFWSLLVQGGLGSLTESVMSTENRFLTKARPWFRILHGLLGLWIYFCGKWQIFGRLKGIETFEKVAYFGMLIFTVSVVVFMEWFNRANFGKKAKKQAVSPREVNAIQRSIVNDILNGSKSAELLRDYPDKMIFQFLNKIYDMTDYTHPGGQLIYQKYRFKEISRYFYGTHPEESLGMGKVNHSPSAFISMNSRLIGVVNANIPLNQQAKVNSQLLNSAKNSQNFAPDDNWNLYYQQKPTIKAFSDEHWTLSQKFHVTNNLTVVNFQNSKYINKIKLRGVDWIGKHYYIKDNNKRRPYTQVISLCTEVLQYRQSLLAKVRQDLNAMDKSLQSGESGHEVPVLPDYANYISFGIKPYNTSTALSKKIVTHAKKLSTQFKVEGPFGVGLDLNKAFSGKCVIIAFGTGILPFLDLFDFLFKKTVYSIFKQKGMDVNMVEPNQDYESFFPNANFTFYGAFREPNDFYGQDWIGEMYQLNREHNLGYFDCEVRVKSQFETRYPVRNGRFDKRFLKKVLVDSGREVERLVLCASDKVMRNMTDWCRELGFPEGRIHYI
jgi:NAD(P)H-flavin reductase